jgi:hypothetical protein
MAVIEQRTRASGLVLRRRLRRDFDRLPLGVALPLIGILSASLWIGLFRLLAWLF